MAKRLAKEPRYADLAAHVAIIGHHLDRSNGSTATTKEEAAAERSGFRVTTFFLHATRRNGRLEEVVEVPAICRGLVAGPKQVPAFPHTQRNRFTANTKDSAAQAARIVRPAKWPCSVAPSL